MLIQPNIKARRLGYIKLMLLFLEKDSGKRELPLRFAHFATQSDDKLSSYKDWHGQIFLDKNPRKSATPYVKLAESLDLIKKRNNSYSLSEHYPFQYESSPFKLYSEERMWFLNLFLRHDPIGLFLVFVMIENKTSYLWLRDNHDAITLELVDRLPYNHFLTSTLNLLASNTDNKLAKSSFFLPRLHWYYDLELLQLEYSITKSKTESLSAIGLDTPGIKLKRQITQVFDELDTMDKSEFVKRMRLLSKISIFDV
ncbi:MAG: hypothetical protein RIC06_10595 [Cyclobacteriaceae bacterium]